MATASKGLSAMGTKNASASTANDSNGMSKVEEDVNNAAAVHQLIQSARTQDNFGDKDDKVGGLAGPVIAAPSRNKLHVRAAAAKDARPTSMVEKMDDDEVFRRELSHHAADVAPTSSVYARVAVGDFGSALLRGMGWTGGDGASDPNRQRGGNKGEKTQIKQRPHRLGLGATPAPPPPPPSSGGGGGGIHRRARRPDEVKRDEERRRQAEEAEAKEQESQRRNVQVTLQRGSVVRLLPNEDEVGGSCRRHDGGGRAVCRWHQL